LIKQLYVTSGIAGPMWGGRQLDIGRISLLNGAIDISKLKCNMISEIKHNHVVQDPDPRVFTRMNYYVRTYHSRGRHLH